MTPPVPMTGSAMIAATFSGPSSATDRRTSSMSLVEMRAVSGTSDDVP